MKNKKIFLITIIIIISIFFILLLGLKKEQNYIPESKLSIIKNNISFKTLYSEEKIFLNDLLKEKPYNLINIWASWCAPCKEEHPYLIELSFNDRINIVGINYKDNIKNAKNFLFDLGNPYKKVLVDNSGVKSIELGAIGVPETYLLKDNKIIKKFIGPLNKITFDEISEIIKK